MKTLHYGNQARSRFQPEAVCLRAQNHRSLVSSLLAYCSLFQCPGSRMCLAAANITVSRQLVAEHFGILAGGFKKFRPCVTSFWPKTRTKSPFPVFSLFHRSLSWASASPSSWLTAALLARAGMGWLPLALSALWKARAPTGPLSSASLAVPAPGRPNQLFSSGA